jgi:hypothetical protein
MLLWTGHIRNGFNNCKPNGKQPRTLLDMHVACLQNLCLQTGLALAKADLQGAKAHSTVSKKLCCRQRIRFLRRFGCFLGNMQRGAMTLGCIDRSRRLDVIMQIFG